MVRASPGLLDSKVFFLYNDIPMMSPKITGNIE